MTMVSKKFEEAQTSLIRRRANRDAVANVLAAEQKNAEDLGKTVQGITDCISLMQNFSSTLRSDVVRQFEDLLTKGVRQVFNKDYRIGIEFQTPGNSVWADFHVTLPDGKRVNLASGEGGGLRDFVGILQRILYIILEPTAPSRILFLDENLKALDSERSPVAFKFISDLTRELGIQCVFITHAQAAKAMAGTDGVKVLEIYNDGTQAQVKVV